MPVIPAALPPIDSSGLTLARRLREVRYSQLRLATDTDYSLSMVKSVCAGRRRASARFRQEVIRALAQAGHRMSERKLFGPGQ